MRKPPSRRASNLSELHETRGSRKRRLAGGCVRSVGDTLGDISGEPNRIFNAPPLSFCNFCGKFNLTTGTSGKCFRAVITEDDIMERAVETTNQRFQVDYREPQCNIKVLRVSSPFMFHHSDQQLACERHLFPASLFHPGFNLIKSVKEEMIGGSS